jgi:ATP-dependent Lon protease
LLEVLDPAQNGTFSDHYLNVPFDLSKVLFIATANQLDPIPRPLLDRLEVIPIAGYTAEEKVEIARSYLIPHQITENGLTESNINWSPKAVLDLVTDYTRESGVRGLERKIATICRKTARRTAEGNTSTVSVSRRSLEKLLGPAPFEGEKVSTVGEVGICNGLAWTESGGEILTIEATLTPGKGLVLTGQLGDVMKESAQTALTFVRGRGSKLGYDESLFSRNQVHVHVPAGAIPKDGPSAGISMATSLFSLATHNPIRPDVAMTGEITLRGRVLPIGGIREKALAAMRAGITTVILPRRNLQDLRNAPKELKRRVKFIPVDTMDEVLDVALDWETGRRSIPRALPKVAAVAGAAVSAKSEE